jgi:hypothetical protein
LEEIMPVEIIRKADVPITLEATIQKARVALDAGQLHATLRTIYAYLKQGPVPTFESYFTDHHPTLAREVREAVDSAIREVAKARAQEFAASVRKSSHA